MVELWSFDYLVYLISKDLPLINALSFPFITTGPSCGTPFCHPTLVILWYTIVITIEVRCCILLLKFELLLRSEEAIMALKVLSLTYFLDCLTVHI